jgi:predicted nucleic acid-binding protein
MTDQADAAVVHIDANPFIYFLEGGEEIANQVRPFFKLLTERPGVATTSELTLAEVLAKAPREIRRGYLNLIIWSKNFLLHPVTRDILIETAEYRQVIRKAAPNGQMVKELA